MNRILQHLHHACPCESATRELESVRLEIERIESACEGTIEFIIPGVMSYIDGKRSVGMFITTELDDTEIGTDVTLHTIQQLRAAARELGAAADRLEGTVSL